MGCIVILLNTDTTKLLKSVSMLNVSRNNINCVNVTEPGRYSMMVHDWESNGGISDQPAVKMMMDITRAAPSPPDPVIQEPRCLYQLARVIVITNIFTIVINVVSYVIRTPLQIVYNNVNYSNSFSVYSNSFSVS